MNKLEPRRITSYEGDFALWSAEQAALMRAGHLDRIDIENIAEEIESLGKGQRRDIDAHISVLLVWLLRWFYQPEYRCGKWRSFIHTERHRLSDILEDSPSLRDYPARVLAEEYAMAREKIAIETTVFLDLIPETCPYTIEQILDPDFYPGGE